MAVVSLEWAKRSEAAVVRRELSKFLYNFLLFYRTLRLHLLVENNTRKIIIYEIIRTLFC